MVPQTCQKGKRVLHCYKCCGPQPLFGHADLKGPHLHPRTDAKTEWESKTSPAFLGGVNFERRQLPQASKAEAGQAESLR